MTTTLVALFLSLIASLHLKAASSFCFTPAQCNRHLYLPITTHRITHRQSWSVLAFSHTPDHSISMTTVSSTPGGDKPSNLNNKKQILTEAIQKLKTVLKREYLTFFNPMQTEYYSSQVTFDDPMTSLSGVQSYQSNVDMLASRTWMGKILFQDARILLHSITGGHVVEEKQEDDTSSSSLQMEPLTTRWTLTLTLSILPWKPTAIFSGISEYQLKPDFSTDTKVQIVKQVDYWDSINIQPDSRGQYQKVPSSQAMIHFVQQLLPRGPASQAAGQKQIPYTLLRKGNGYDVRLYPAMTLIQAPYTRREEGYDLLGSFLRENKNRNQWENWSPLILEVQNTGRKIMSWPVAYVPPDRQTSSTSKVEKNLLVGKTPWENISVVTIPSLVVAIGTFEDASVEPVVRRVDQEVRKALERDGLIPSDASGNSVRFAQYDAVYSMGTRRGEVWIDLAEGGHPW